MKMLCSIAAIPILLLLKPGLAAGSAVDSTQLAEFVITGMTTQRQQLVSGEFKVEEHRRVENGKPESLGKLTAYGAFDQRTQAYRFDRSRKLRVLTTNEDQGAFEIIDRRTKLILRPEGMLQWVSSLPSHVQLTDASTTKAEGEAFDARAIGLVTTGDLARFPTLEGLLQIFSTQDIIDAQEIELQKYRVSWKFGTTELLRRNLYIDADKGFTPYRLEICTAEAAEDDAAATAIQWHEPGVVCECTWEPDGGTWVPILATFSDGKPGQLSERRRLAFDWQNVNQPLSEDTFSARGMKLPHTVSVVDSRLGTPFVVEIVHPTNTTPEQLTTQVVSPTTRWLIFGNIAVFSAVVMIHLYRRRTGHRASSNTPAV